MDIVPQKNGSSTNYSSLYFDNQTTGSKNAFAHPASTAYQSEIERRVMEIKASYKRMAPQAHAHRNDENLSPF